LSDASTPAPAGSAPVISTHPLLGVLGVLFGAMTATFTGRLISVGLTDLRGAMHLGVDEASWISTVFNAALMFIGPFSVYLGGLLGPRRVLLACAALFTVISLVLPFAGSLPLLFALLVLAGLSAGTFYPLTLSFVLRNLPPRYVLIGIAAYAMDIVFTTNFANSLELERFSLRQSGIFSFLHGPRSRAAPGLAEFWRYRWADSFRRGFAARYDRAKAVDAQSSCKLQLPGEKKHAASGVRVDLLPFCDAGDRRDHSQLPGICPGLSPAADRPGAAMGRRTPMSLRDIGGLSAEIHRRSSDPDTGIFTCRDRGLDECEPLLSLVRQQLYCFAACHGHRLCVVLQRDGRGHHP
jgi:hypothetical protein